MLQAPQGLGFSPEAEARDRSQMLFLAALVRQGADRFILKGGLAMRALYGSARLTKDIDFDAEDSVSPQSMRNQLPKALTNAARRAGLTAPVVQQTKAGDKANRWRLEGLMPGGVRVTFEVEVSKRGVPDDAYVMSRQIAPPFEYRMSPFFARVYTETAMAAGKVNALMSPNRSVPRDVYDLYDLGRHGADPTPLWIARIPREALERKRLDLDGKVAAIRYDQAVAELLPYLPPDQREAIDDDAWETIRTGARDYVRAWLDTAISRATSAEELGHDPTHDPDLAGR